MKTVCTSILISSAVIIAILIANVASAQTWTALPLSDLPMPASNNAVCGYSYNGNFFLYSFSGIDSSKTHSGINLNSYKYSSGFNTWDSIPPLPNGLSRIAASASVIKDKIYIIGGYHVAQNGNETSLSHVHIYDPQSDIYLNDGSNTLIPIDDHVQVSWRDSLIYVITGWSNSNNVSAVQVYNPSTDSWSFANNLPDPDYRVFGAAGTVVEDTIYYIGGAGNWNGSTFPLIPEVRIGVIDPANPLNISWQSIIDSNAALYRPAAFSYLGLPYWAGGGLNSYNYDGVAYDGSGVVGASNKIRFYSFSRQEIDFSQSRVEAVMDMRGVGTEESIGGDFSFYIVGGMDSFANVNSNCIRYASLNLAIKPAIAGQGARVIYSPSGVSINVYGSEFEIFDISGRKVLHVENSKEEYFLAFGSLKAGLYTLLSLDSKGNVYGDKLLMF